MTRTAAKAITLTCLALVYPCSANADVLAVQTFLADKGCEPGALDGQWGRGSKGAAERFEEITGVVVTAETNIASLPLGLVSADCNTDISLPAPDSRPRYVTPAEVIDLPGGISQYNWIPLALEDFAWEAGDAPFVDLEARAVAFTVQQKQQLGCSTAANEAAIARIAEMRDQPHDFQTMVVDANFLNHSGQVLVSAFCMASNEPLNELVAMFAKMAAEGAFLDIDIRDRALVYHEHVVNNPIQPDSVSGLAAVVSQTLAFRESLANFLIAWSVAKHVVTPTAVDVAAIEAWLGKLVELQAFSFAESPLDCPSYDMIVSPIPRMINRSEGMRWDQYGECINTGTSRAGVSALWAMVSGDRAYAVDALNIFSMTLYLQRYDGSNILESPRQELAHYKSVYNVAWMTVVAEAFATRGIDLYGLEVEDRSILDAMAFLARAALDQDLIEHYGPSTQAWDPFELKDPWHWIVVDRFPDSVAARLVTREFAGTWDREEVFNKAFNVYVKRSETQQDRNALLPFTAFYAPTNFSDYLPADIKLPGSRTLTAVSADDDPFAGTYMLTWEVRNGNDANNVNQSGPDALELALGTGTVTRAASYRDAGPTPVELEALRVEYDSSGKVIISGDITIDPSGNDVSYPTTLTGQFAEKRTVVTGTWDEGDTIIVYLVKKPVLVQQ